MNAQINLLSDIHNFVKSSLTTVITRRGNYDLYECKRCGLKGRRHGIGSNYIQIGGKFNEMKFEHCDGSYLTFKDDYVGKVVEIIFCNCQSPAFDNIEPKTKHTILTPPEGERNGDMGVWIQGKGEIVKILFPEFNLVKRRRRTK